MAAIVNDRDVLLQAASVRQLTMPLPGNILVPGVTGINLTASSLLFKIASGGTPTPTSIDFTAELKQVSGTVVWDITAGTATLTGTGNTRNLVPANMFTDSVTVRARITFNSVTYQSLVTVVKIYDGTSGGGGGTGTRGSRTLFPVSSLYTSSYGLANYRSAATSQIAAATAGSTPTTPIKGDMVVFSNGVDNAFSLTNDGTYATNGDNSWVPPGQVYDGSLLVTESVTSAKLAATAIDGKTITGATIRTASSGARIELAGNTLRATNSSGANLIEFSTGGKALFTGGAYDPAGAGNFGAAVAKIGTPTNQSVICGFYGYVEAPPFGGGQGVRGESGPSDPFGVGTYGLAIRSDAVGVLASNAAGGVALQIAGNVNQGYGTSYTWAGYTISTPGGSTTLSLHNDGQWRDPVTTARVNAAFGVSSSGVCQIIVGNSGTCTVGGGGFNLVTGTGLVGTYDFFGGPGNVITLQSTSDRRLKKEIQPETLGLSFLVKVKPVSYVKIGQKRRSHGFIYQDLVRLVDKNDGLACLADNGMGSVDYISMIAVLVKSVQELNNEVQRLKQPWFKRLINYLFK